MGEPINSIPVEVLRTLVTEIQTSTAVDWDPRRGGCCPLCGAQRCRVMSTRPWNGSVRLRWHRCPRCGHRFKSVQQG
ncbi:hypothetical protein LWC08_02945 [Desulfobaculum bizertense]|uniref:hypothetical protein n=1 Tax=Desulfobaculum bizertense TaxID=376490 RepID=UPI001F314F5A|nr:hypothetical protein [Desulfobaculum bizertense]UIJ38542.1 hypothetical protein LWC08_02945 [Desulfobaculum bizertense]